MSNIIDESTLKREKTKIVILSEGLLAENSVFPRDALQRAAISPMGYVCPKSIDNAFYKMKIE